LKVENWGFAKARPFCFVFIGQTPERNCVKLPNGISPTVASKYGQLSRQNAANWHICRKKVGVFAEFLNENLENLRLIEKKAVYLQRICEVRLRLNN